MQKKNTNILYSYAIVMFSTVAIFSFSTIAFYTYQELVKNCKHKMSLYDCGNIGLIKNSFYSYAHNKQLTHRSYSSILGAALFDLFFHGA